MKFRLTLWLGGVVLVAALPAWADGVHYGGVADESRSVEVSTKAASNSGTKIVTRTRAGFRARLVPAGPSGAYRNPHFEFAEEPNVEASARVIDKPSTESNAPANAGFPPEEAHQRSPRTLPRTRPLRSEA
jgi:hypothetical protein